VHQNQHPAFRGALPYVVAYVQLEEGPQLLTNIVGCDPADVAVGMPVRVEFVPTPVESKGGAGDEALGVRRFGPA